MMRARRAATVGLLTACLLVPGGAVAQNLGLKLRPIFEGMEPLDGPYPVRVELTNKGPDARGVLKVTAGSYEMNYPVELPTGARKELVAYPFRVAIEGDAMFTLTTDRGRIQKRLQSEGWSYAEPSHVALISDAAGELVFVRKDSRSEESYRPQAVKDVYVSPREAPDRPVGYVALSAVVLGEGSERLDDSQVAALQTWVLAGGRLVFPGGAPNPLLSDPRWAAFLPVRHLRPSTVPGEALAGKGQLGATIPVLLGDPAPGALPLIQGTKGKILAWEKPVGLGRTIYWAFDPFSPPVSRWEGRREVFMNTVRPLDRSASTIIGPYVASSSQYALGVVPPNTMPSPSDPFNVQPLPAGRVFWVLAAFFVAVVPLNFFILRRMKRGELAWITSPILSLGFGAYFLASAGSLYSAKLSRATRGLLIGTEGSPHAYFLGRAEIFFPRGGNYDLGFSRVDQVRPGEDVGDDYYYRHRGGQTPFMSDLAAIDLGEVRAPRMSTGNLSFREFTFRQVVDLGGGFRLGEPRVQPGGKPRYRARFVNASPYTLRNAVVQWTGMSAKAEGPIPPGKEVQLVFPATNAIRVEDLTRATTLEADLEGPLRVGPQIGEVVGPRSRIHLYYTLAPEIGK